LADAGEVSNLVFQSDPQSSACSPRKNSVDVAGLPVVSRSVDLIDQCVRQAALYPRWLVVTCTVLAGIAALWIVAKLLKWTLILLLTFTVVAIVGGVLLWWLG
jgi:hypothetical protein